MAKNCTGKIFLLSCCLLHFNSLIWTYFDLFQTVVLKLERGTEYPFVLVFLTTL